MSEHNKNIQDKIINNFCNNTPTSTNLPFTSMGTQRGNPYWSQANGATFDSHLGEVNDINNAINPNIKVTMLSLDENIQEEIMI